MTLEGNVNDWNWAEELSTNGQPQDLNFFDFYVPRMRNEVNMFPGIGKTIKDLSKKYNLIIISSSLTEPIAEFLEKNNLRDCFIDIMGNDIHHSKTEKIKMVFSNYGIESDKCVFITDTLGDVMEASQMNVGAIGVSWGFHPRETLVRGKCFRIVDCPEDIPEAVSEYLALDFIK